MIEFVYYFAIYSFVGWLIEIAYVSYYSKKFVNRGFLFGPFCPIYGFGAISTIIVISPLAQHHIILFFLGATFITSAIEYLTSYFSETFFHVSWWNYSQEKYNLHGRICLRNSLYWGLLSVLFITFFHPSLATQITRLASFSPVIIPSLIIIYFASDFVFTIVSLRGFKKILKQFSQLTTNTIDSLQLDQLRDDIVTKQYQLLTRFNKKYRRFIKAFPNLTSSKYYILDDIKVKIDSLKAKK